MLRKLPLPEMHLKIFFNIQSEQVPNGSFNVTHTNSFCGPGTKGQKRLNEGKLIKVLRELIHWIELVACAFKTHSAHSKTRDRNNSDDI
jgi:hypothetical protein